MEWHLKNPKYPCFLLFLAYFFLLFLRACVLFSAFFFGPAYFFQFITFTPSIFSKLLDLSLHPELCWHLCFSTSLSVSCSAHLGSTFSSVHSLIQRCFMGYLPYSRHVLQQIVRNCNHQSPAHSVVNPLLYACQGLRYRKLEVILTTGIDKLGKAGETVKVAPGYFRNHLMPKLLAVPNIDKFAYLISEQRKIYQPSEEEEEEEEVKVTGDSKEDKMREYEKAALCLDKSKLVLRRFINVQKAQSRETKAEPLELCSAVTKEDLVAEVARQLFVNIAPDNLHLPTPLSTVGEYEVPLRLPRSIPLPEGKINWTLKVKIRSK